MPPAPKYGHTVSELLDVVAWFRVPKLISKGNHNDSARTRAENVQGSGGAVDIVVPIAAIIDTVAEPGEPNERTDALARACRFSFVLRFCHRFEVLPTK